MGGAFVIGKCNPGKFSNENSPALENSSTFPKLEIVKFKISNCLLAPDEEMR
jgi:hypothetical protein